MFRRIAPSVVVAGIWLAGIAMAPSAAFAQERIGRADVVRNDVTDQRAAGVIRISAGDALDRNDTVRTAADSDTKIVLLDDTNLSLGPNSSMKLDRAVLADDSHYRSLVVRLTSGAFRWVTGHSAKPAYVINTPIATIGVRGTKLDIHVTQVETYVGLRDAGQAQVCAIGGGCVQLLIEGDSAVVTSANGTTKITKLNTLNWTFDAACGNDPALCNPTQFASAVQTIVDDIVAALCGQ